jgi:poly-beta-1,6-N-acetyl-D-glucosamine synthase
MDKWILLCVRFFEYGIFFYCMGILSSYLIMGIVSARAVLRYRRERDLTDFNELLSSPLLPSLTIIAPAYNESMTIVDNVRSLMSLHYGELTIVIVNDGSKDDTLQKAVEAYDMVQDHTYIYTPTLDAKPVRGVYRSRNPAFRKLLVVDKQNGGKADAINVGINLAESDYFACIDVDCIIEADAFLKMVKPVLQAPPDVRVVAVGGIVWLTNDSTVEGGRLTHLKTPDTFIARIQVIEYFRAFLLGRTAWAEIDGLLLISGAFGIFDRKLTVEIGGYNHKTVGEDMELVMRMHKTLRLRGEKYKVAYIPEPLCWTEAPSDYAVLGRQRHRWTRGTLECLLMYKTMFFNPKYGILGMVSYPYWFFAEWLAPFAEAGGLIFFGILCCFGLVNWQFFWAMCALVYAFAILVSVLSIYVQELSYGRYEQRRDIWKLLLTVLIEPFVYHPRTVYWSLKGNYDWMRGKNVGWGNMTRAGFAKK